LFGKELNLFSEVSLGGIFLAECIDNMDPKGLERVKLRVLGVHDWENKEPDNAIWADHIAPSKYSSGEIPDPGDMIMVMFFREDPMRPLWLGWARFTKG
jgi:hypothetical protein